MKEEYTIEYMIHYVVFQLVLVAGFFLIVQCILDKLYWASILGTILTIAAFSGHIINEKARIERKRAKARKTDNELEFF